MGNTVKAMFVNGSPRKNWNTAKMLENAIQGATEAGAECDFRFVRHAKAEQWQRHTSV